MKAFSRSRFFRALQAGGLLVLGLLLWTMNVFPVQQRLLVYECTALVSERGSAEPADGWMGEVPARKVRFRIGTRSRASVPDLERELGRLMSVGSENDRGTATITRVVSQARWKLQVAEHALARFRLDCARLGLDLEPSKEASPFRLASQGAQNAKLCDCEMHRSLCDEVETARKTLADEESASRCGMDRSPRLVSLIGTPRYVIRGGSLATGNAVSLLVVAFFIPFGIAMRGRFSDRTPSRHSDLMRSLRVMQIPYLGVLRVPAVNRLEKSSQELGSRERGENRIRSSKWLSNLYRWSDGVLGIWIVCFMVRYLCDPLWRELLFQAPLAAFSSLLFGV
jgi:hypothetical protein